MEQFAEFWIKFKKKKKEITGFGLGGAGWELTPVEEASPRSLYIPEIRWTSEVPLRRFSECDRFSVAQPRPHPELPVAALCSESCGTAITGSG